MKTKLFLALLALTCLCTVGCKEGELDSRPELQHIMAIEVVDQNGENVLADVKEDLIENASGEAICVEYGTQKVYKQVILNRLHKGVNYFINRICTGLSIENCPSEVTWKVKCKEVFGDEELHTIESKWERDGESYSLNCKSIEFEGKTYATELKNDILTARVVVNR